MDCRKGTAPEGVEDGACVDAAQEAELSSGEQQEVHSGVGEAPSAYEDRSGMGW